MNELVLWRRISSTDFRAMNGKASPKGRGGGAMHIVLGVRSEHFPIDAFLEVPDKTEAILYAAADPDRQKVAQLAFDGNPHRRGGEWRIRDQYSHRHPAWSPLAGFPSEYDADDPPILLVFKVGKALHARFTFKQELINLNASDRPTEIFSSNTGISAASRSLLKKFSVPTLSHYEDFLIQSEDLFINDFDPKNISDGRKKIISAVIRRLGQRKFRRNLINAYGGKCAMTKCDTLWVLEAAHISPYRGAKTNATTNGLLLRADVHTLFDLGLISVEPGNLLVRASRMLSGSPYEALDGKRLELPAKPTLHPNLKAIEYHYRQFHP
ncbi:hypothetical protein GFL95_36270 [Rhizobium leguminosarum bv. viciae]|uniref:HNH endonuclease n=1 Tax=Rhizobium leguminosarum TaxID=384 RepID=UPI001441E205|nr:HNH endonuclease [Rhizobium leguminosarum]NKK96542.1 hypothetical protein [Rhizobium leguminosarum bv. viciae]